MASALPPWSSLGADACSARLLAATMPIITSTLAITAPAA
jgi:hypothetical protein